MTAITIDPTLPRITDTLVAAAHRAGNPTLARTVEVINGTIDRQPWTLTELEKLCRGLDLTVDDVLDGSSDGWEVLAS